jgi:hypothetical protein
MKLFHYQWIEDVADRYYQNDVWTQIESQENEFENESKVDY